MGFVKHGRHEYARVAVAEAVDESDAEPVIGLVMLGTEVCDGDVDAGGCADSDGADDEVGDGNAPEDSVAEAFPSTKGETHEQTRK